MLNLLALKAYWSGPTLEANVLIAMNLLGSLLLGMLVGYERAYHGRAAGMRTYGLVCMASCALMVFVGYETDWYGGAGSPSNPDPTRVVQGIVTGIGFVCAGSIMREGLSINGLTTAASLWVSSAMGIMVGVGFYGAAVVLAVLTLLSMTAGRFIQERLPTKESLSIVLRFQPGTVPDEKTIVAAARSKGYDALMSRLAVSSEDGHLVWRFPLEAVGKKEMRSRAELAKELWDQKTVHSFSLEPARH
ncbi:MgtC/SapB family protein [Burkholderia multivorans]|uniref:MgtC/SapB family protein n=1 Tax=Burkholderia multivorans TaxID=87883 RepID=UPI001C240F8C|nr:MgtC/SapB family protein [Burkholderia multivorans]MBU9200332.1 MgtC/SapB family protein [Burkholderia multivorans]MDN8078542.1 MgtC/SapB family protein [Burkholderia multivorans]